MHFPPLQNSILPTPGYGNARLYLPRATLPFFSPDSCLLNTQVPHSSPSPQCAQVTLLYSITTVCDDRAWLLGHTSTIKQLADTAASKFAVYDAVMHTKLCVALAAANVCPAADW